MLNGMIVNIESLKPESSHIVRYGRVAINSICSQAFLFREPNMSKRFIRKDSIAPLCACGCGKRVKKSKLYPYNWNKFINGHGRRGKNWRKKPPDSEAPLCECGYCNERTKWNQGQNRWDRFIDRHQFRGKNNWSYGTMLEYF